MGWVWAPTFTSGAVIGSGLYTYADFATETPKTILSTGSWRATEVLRWIPTEGGVIFWEKCLSDWREVSRVRIVVTINTALLAGIPDGTDFYFVHSYHLNPGNPEHSIGTTPYCGCFTSVVAAGSALGVQFHPEKSGLPGFQLLKNFIQN